MGVRTHPIFTNFSAGEVSPKMSGRVDWAKWQAGCVTLENFRIQPQGGVVGRPGLRFVAEVKDSSKAVRVIPFRPSDTARYVLEVGTLYLRVYSDGARVEVASVPVEIQTPYAEADLFDLHYGQMEDVLVLVNQGYAPRKLARFSDTEWRMNALTFTPPASRHYGTRTTTYLVPPATTGTNIQLDTGANIFLASDVGRVIIAGLASATITVVDSASRVHADIVDDFPSLAQVSAGDWYIQDSPLVILTPSATGPVGATITLALSDEGWRAADVGKYVLASGGVAEITAFTTASLVTAKVLVAFESVTPQEAGAWSLEEAAWSSENGYPATVGFFEGRMLLGGSTGQRNTFWASASQDLLNFALGSTDDASMNVKANSGEANTVRWFSPRRTLLMGTSSDEYTITGGNDAAITPSNIRVRPATPHGSSTIMPIRAEHATLFVTGNKRLLREMAYAYEVDDYRSPDMLSIAEHLTGVYTLEDLAYQRPPESTVWAVRSDGTLLGFTYLRDQEITGWCRYVTDGAFESVCTIPSPDGTTEQVWVVVRRTINGATKRYIEYFDPDSTFHSTSVRGLRTDSCVLYDGAATTTVTGLDHLEGQEVAIVGDGSVYPTEIVTGGQVTLSGPAAAKIEVGLPFTCTLTPNRPEVPINGTSQARSKSWGEITVRLKDTQGVTINGETVPWRSAGDPMGVAPPHFTGDKKVTNLGWDTDGYVTIQQTKPCHIEVLAITGTLVVGD